MDSPTSNPNPQPIVPDVPTRDDEETRSPSVDRSQSSEGTIPNEYPVVPQLANHEAPMAMDDEDRVYGCKYCIKMFTNKQALGGHQNAHKVERTLEKTMREAQENGLGYLGGPSAPHFLASYPRPHDHMSRSYLTWPYPSTHERLPIRYNPRPMAPIPVEPSGPRPLPSFGLVYGRWSAPFPRHPQFPGYPHHYVANHGSSYRFLNAGEGSSSSAKPVYEHHQGPSALTLRLGPSENPRDGNNASRINEQVDKEIDESGLDLTLRL